MVSEMPNGPNPLSSIRNEADRLLIEIEKNLSDKKVFLQLLKNKTEKMLYPEKELEKSNKVKKSKENQTTNQIIQHIPIDIGTRLSATSSLDKFQTLRKHLKSSYIDKYHEDTETFQSSLLSSGPETDYGKFHQINQKARRKSIKKHRSNKNDLSQKYSMTEPYIHESDASMSSILPEIHNLPSGFIQDLKSRDNQKSNITQKNKVSLQEDQNYTEDSLKKDESKSQPYSMNKDESHIKFQHQKISSETEYTPNVFISDPVTSNNNYNDNSYHLQQSQNKLINQYEKQEPLASLISDKESNKINLESSLDDNSVRMKLQNRNISHERTIELTADEAIAPMNEKKEEEKKWSSASHEKSFISDNSEFSKNFQNAGTDKTKNKIKVVDKSIKNSSLDLSAMSFEKFRELTGHY